MSIVPAPPTPHAIFNPDDYESLGYLTKAEAMVLYCTKAYADSRYLRLTGGTMTGVLASASTTQSTRTSSGSITTLGGVGVARNLYVGGDTRIQSTTLTTRVGTGALVVSGGLSVAYDTYTNGRIITTETQDGSEFLQGSIVTYGGIASAKTICGSKIQAYGTGVVTPGTLSTGALQVTAGGVSALGSIQTTTGQVYTGDGALATPGFAFASNPNCGVHRLSANTVGFVCNSATSLAATTAGAYVVGRLGVGLSSVPGSNQLYVQTFSGVSPTTPLVIANGTSGGNVRSVAQSTAAEAYAIWDTTAYGGHIGVRHSDGFVCLGTTSNNLATGPNQITISPAGVVNISTRLTIAGTSVFGYSQPMGLNQTNVGNAWLSAPCPSSASVTIHATQPYTGGPVQLEISTSTWTATATAATITIPVALNANFRPTVGPLIRPFCYFIPGFTWEVGIISITTTGFMTLSPATGNWISGTQYHFANSTTYQIAAL